MSLRTPVRVSVLFQLRTPFNWLLMNLSVTELVMASTGNPILSYNSFLGQWSFSQTICRMNALGMTYLGKIPRIKIQCQLLQQLLNPYRNSVHCDADRAGSPEVHDGHQVCRPPGLRLKQRIKAIPGINSFHYQRPAPPSSLWSLFGSTPPSCHFLLLLGLAPLVSTLLV